MREQVRDAIYASEDNSLTRRSFIAAAVASGVFATSATAQSGGPVNFDRLVAEIADTSEIATELIAGNVVNRAENITRFDASTLFDLQGKSPSNYPNTIGFYSSSQIGDDAYAFRFDGTEWVNCRFDYSDGSSWDTADTGPMHGYSNGNWVSFWDA